MNRKYFEELQQFYNKELEETLSFWYNYGYDKEHGGFYTCLERNGDVYDTDKSVWAQGRGMWVFARAYNFIKKDPRYLKAAQDAYDFVTKHCFDTEKILVFRIFYCCWLC